MQNTPEALQSLMGINIVYHEYDVAEKLLESAIGVPICVQCGKCCQENTPIAYGLEAANVVSRLIGKGVLYQFQRRIEGWLQERHKECTIYESVRLDRVTNGLNNKLRDEVLALSHTQCPFYEDSQCLIHEFRPLVCRAFGVTRNGLGCNRPTGRMESESSRMIVREIDRAGLRQDLNVVLRAVPRPTWNHAGFFPTLIYAHAWPESFAKLTANGLIASAKLTMTYPTMAVIFEEDVEKISLTNTDLFRDGQKQPLGV